MKFNGLVFNDKIKCRVDTTLPKGIVSYIKNNGYKINELIRLGILAKEDNPQLIDRIEMIENRFKVIENKLSIIMELLNGNNSI